MEDVFAAVRRRLRPFRPVLATVPPQCTSRFRFAAGDFQVPEYEKLSRLSHAQCASNTVLSAEQRMWIYIQFLSRPLERRGRPQLITFASTTGSRSLTARNRFASSMMLATLNVASDGCMDASGQHRRESTLSIATIPLFRFGRRLRPRSSRLRRPEPASGLGPFGSRSLAPGALRLPAPARSKPAKRDASLPSVRNHRRQPDGSAFPPFAQFPPALPRTAISRTPRQPFGRWAHPSQARLAGVSRVLAQPQLLRDPARHVAIHTAEHMPHG